MTDDSNFFAEDRIELPVQDVPVVFKLGITGVPEETANELKADPSAKPMIGMTFAFLRFHDLDTDPPTASIHSSFLAISMEAHAQFVATSEAERELWSDADRTRFGALVDQHKAAGRQARQWRKAAKCGWRSWSGTPGCIREVGHPGKHEFGKNG